MTVENQQETQDTWKTATIKKVEKGRFVGIVFQKRRYDMKTAILIFGAVCFYVWLACKVGDFLAGEYDRPPTRLPDDWMPGIEENEDL